MKLKVFLPLIVIIVALFLIQALICNFASAEGVDLALVREDMEKLEKENRALEAEIITFSSLTRLASSAAQLDLFPVQVVYTSFDLPVAMGKRN